MRQKTYVIQHNKFKDKDFHKSFDQYPFIPVVVSVMFATWTQNWLDQIKWYFPRVYINIYTDFTWLPNIPRSLIVLQNSG